jgi:small subunit ribosomal protein S1
MPDNNQDVSMNEMMDAIDASMHRISTGDLVNGKIISVSESELLVNIGYMADGVVPRSEITDDENINLKEIFNPDEEIKVCVLEINNGEGNVLLSKKEADKIKVWDDLESAFNSGDPINVKVKEAVKGGAVAYYNGVRIFIPISQLSLNRVEDANAFKDKELSAKIIEFDKNNENVVVSAKEIEKAEAAKKREQLLNSITKGEKREGIVTRLVKFGAFVDLGGVEGLIHISELSWKRVNSPSEVVSEGDRVSVYVLDVDKEKGRISLALKDVKDDPWNDIFSKYQINAIVEGKVTKFIKVGAFVELEPGLDGLVHISEISEERVANPADKLTIGDTVKVKILDINEKEKRISLSMKDAADKPVEDYSKFQESDNSSVTLGDVFKDKFKNFKFE